MAQRRVLIVQGSDTKILLGEKMTWVAQPISAIAISYSDYLEYGCPICKSGEKSGYTSISYNNTVGFVCGNCGVSYFVCYNGVEKAEIGAGDTYPLVTPHPLRS